MPIFNIMLLAIRKFIFTSCAESVRKIYKFSLSQLLSQQQIGVIWYKYKLITNNPNCAVCVYYDIRLTYCNIHSQCNFAKDQTICNFICKAYEDSLTTQLNTLIWATGLLKNTGLGECNSHNRLNRVSRIGVDHWTGLNKLLFTAHMIIGNTSQDIQKKGSSVLTVLL